MEGECRGNMSNWNYTSVFILLFLLLISYLIFDMTHFPVRKKGKGKVYQSFAIRQGTLYTSR